MSETPQTGSRWLLPRERVNALLERLRDEGYTPVGPTVRDGAIVHDTLQSGADLPEGWTEEQDGGTYRLRRREDDAWFGYAAGPHSWKQFLHPPRLRLWAAERDDRRGFRITAGSPEAPRYAFIGVRSCDLHAIGIQDRVFTGGPHRDPAYRQRRERAFIVAVQCGTAGGTCFCVSMGTGPRAGQGFDLALTEVPADGTHHFVAEVGSAAGARVLAPLALRAASAAETEAAEGVVSRTAERMGRHMDTRDIVPLLMENLEHPRWEDVAARCLSCANCTMVCPTCFCHTVEEVSELDGRRSERVRHWDSCFTTDFSYIHGGSVRASPRSRYRQWMTHKLATWHGQFGTSGCVGCGRCITWCPVGIDITEEVRAIRNRPAEAEERHGNP